MIAGLKLPVGLALFAALTLAGLMGVFAFNAAPAEAQAVSSDARLMSLSVSHGSTTVTLTPVFSPTTYTYNGSVPNAVATVNVVATAADDFASVEGDGAIDVVEGANYIDVTVTAEDNVTEQTYTVIITRLPKSDNANLESLEVTEGTTTTGVAITPSFAAGTVAYTAEVANSIATVTVAVEAEHSNVDGIAIAAVDEDGTAISTAPNPADNSGEAVGEREELSSVVTLDSADAGEDTVTKITVTVTAEDGSTEKEYVLNVTRKAQSDNADLRTLRVYHTTGTNNRRTNVPTDPRFRGDTQFYTAEVPNSVTTVTVTAVADETSATVGDIAASGGVTVTQVTETPVVTSSQSATVDLVAAATAASVTTVTITVTPEVGAGDANVNNKVYTIVIRRLAPSDDADLKSLSFTHGTGDDETDISISPAFSADTQFYTAKVANVVGTVTVGATANDDNAGVAANAGGTAVTDTEGTADTDDELSGAVTLPDTTVTSTFTTVIVTVTAEDTSTKAYTVVIQRVAASENKDLRALSVSDGTNAVELTPAFDKDKVNYTAEVAYSVNSVSVMATADYEYATVDVSGMEDGMVSLDVGVNPIEIMVTPDIPDDTNTGDVVENAPKTYTVRITRLPESSNAYLSSLSLMDGNNPVALSPMFASMTMPYEAMVANDVTSVTVMATPTHSGANAMVDGGDSLDVGENTITVTVTAEDGSTMTYTITVTRAASSNAYLSSLSLGDVAISPEFAGSTTAYTASVDNSVDSVTVTAMAAHAEATVSGDGMHDLDEGANAITVTVTAEDGTTTKNYTVTVTRAAPANQNQALIDRYDAVANGGNGNGMIR